MKRFITFLKEFIINEPPRGRRPDREFDDNIEKVIKFMDTVPFSHETVDGHEIKFNSALDAAKMLNLNVTKHERAQEHIHNNEVPNPEANKKYFQSSIRTHDHALLKLQDHIIGHQNLPAELVEYVPYAMAKLEDESHERVDEIDRHRPLGREIPTSKITFDRHAHRGTGSHPHENDSLHHLWDVATEVQKKDLGYVLHSDER